MKTRTLKPLKIKIALEDEIICTVYRPSLIPERRGQYVVEEHVGRRMNFETFIYPEGPGCTTPGAMGGLFEWRFDAAMLRGCKG